MINSSIQLSIHWHCWHGYTPPPQPLSHSLKWGKGHSVNVCTLSWSQNKPHLLVTQQRKSTQHMLISALYNEPNNWRGRGGGGYCRHFHKYIFQFLVSKTLKLACAPNIFQFLVSKTLKLACAPTANGPHPPSSFNVIQCSTFWYHINQNVWLPSPFLIYLRNSIIHLRSEKYTFAQSQNV